MKSMKKFEEAVVIILVLILMAVLFWFLIKFG